ncbi:hypothetical protein [Tropicimonas aquimaris]|uniref:Uncharacterized protein n=1 Tax=Tropicimonas aquimaris TaxID=914152 RepID=A0ABW3IQS1_9RHOB
MQQLGISPVVIDRLLGHVNPLAAEGVSGAAASYIFSDLIIEEGPNPERHAMSLFAEAIMSIAFSRSQRHVLPEINERVSSVAEPARQVAKVAFVNSKSTARRTSPWAVAER